MSRVFVSYSHQDEDSARALKSALARHGLDVWLTADEIRPGDKIVDRIRDGLRSASVVVLLVGTQPSTWARNEWSQALQMIWDADRKVPLVPIILPNADPPTFLRDQPHLRIHEDSGDWEDLAKVIETPPTTFRWRTSDIAKSNLARRFNELAKAAAALPEDPEAAS